MSHQEPATRENFADFLERILARPIEQSEWDGFVQTHYRDELLETIRRRVVELKQNQLPVSFESDEAKQTLRAWVLVLRSERPSEETPTVPQGVMLRLSAEEAVVLDNFLYRFSETDELSFQHCAEERVLCNLQSILEREVARPNLPSIDDARRVILGGDN